MFISRKKLNEHIAKEVEARMADSVTRVDQFVERVRVLDFCTAYIALLGTRIGILEDELRRHESIPSIDEIERRSLEYVTNNFDSLMEFYDERRQRMADLVVDYRSRHVPRW